MDKFDPEGFAPMVVLMHVATFDRGYSTVRALISQNKS